MVDNVGDGRQCWRFRELMSRLLKIQIAGHVDGDSESTTDAIKRRNLCQVIVLKGEIENALP